MRLVPISALSLLLLSCVACSSSAPRHTTKAPPLVVCGTQLWNGGMGASLIDATSGAVTVNTVSAGRYIYLRLAEGCSKGAHADIPEGNARIIARASARDGSIAAVVIQPLRNTFDINVKREGGESGVVHVRLSD
jgi:hypothetical protein